jgi:hypothetical protein
VVRDLEDEANQTVVTIHWAGGRHEGDGYAAAATVVSVGPVSSPRAAAALVVDDVHRATRPDDDEIHAVAKDDRSALAVVHRKHERNLMTQLHSHGGEGLRERAGGKRVTRARIVAY